ncbi:MAG: serine/threonine-protein kinase [Gemmataceae bacterium]
MPLDRTAKDWDGPPEIPGYEIIGELGRGGMGVIWKVRQQQPNRIVALKVLRAGLPADVGSRQRFQAEYETLARLQHPGIVQIYEVGEWTVRGDSTTVPYFTMEFCAGGSLATELAGTPISPRSAAEIVECVARTVGAAHRAGIIHRDLKPANILLATGKNSVRGPSNLHVHSDRTIVERGLKVSDFGLAKWLTPDSPNLSNSRTVLGTPAYTAPEQISGFVSPATDIYSLGAILYECLTGRSPFPAVTIIEMLDLVRTREPVPIRQSQPNVPRDLENICLKCLEKDPSKRYLSAEDLADDLLRFLHGQPVTARPVSQIERFRRWANRNPQIAGLTAVLGFALLFGFMSALNLWLNAAFHLKQEELARHEAEDNYLACRQMLAEYVSITRDPRNQNPAIRRAQRETLVKARAICERLGSTRPVDKGLRSDRAEICTALASIDHHEGRYNQALEAGETARELWLQLSNETPDDERFRERLATALGTLGSINVQLGQDHEAENKFRSAINVWKQIPGYHSLLSMAISRRELAGLTNYQGRQPEQNRLLEQNCKQLESVISMGDSDHEFKSELFINLLLLADLYEHNSKKRDAIQCWQRGMQLGRQLREETPDDPSVYYRLAACCLLLAEHDQRLVELQDAVSNSSQAAKFLEARLKRDPLDQEATQLLVNTSWQLADCYIKVGKTPEALVAARRALEILVEVANRRPDDVASQFHVFEAKASLCLRESKCGNQDASKVLARQVATEFIHFCDANSFELPAMSSHLSGMIAPPLRHAGSLEESLIVSVRSCQLFEQLTKVNPNEPKHWIGLSESWTQVGKTNWSLKRMMETESALQKAIDVTTILAKRWPEYQSVLNDRISRLERFRIDRMESGK